MRVDSFTIENFVGFRSFSVAKNYESIPRKSLHSPLVFAAPSRGAFVSRFGTASRPNLHAIENERSARDKCNQLSMMSTRILFVRYSRDHISYE